MKKIPGPKTLELIERYKKVLATTTHDSNFPISNVKGKGIYLWDADGNKFIDCFSQVSIADLGYGHPKVLKAVNRQMETLSACIPTDVYNDAQIEAAEKLTGITKKSFSERDWRVFFCSSGAEANNAAVKLLLDLRPQRRIFISYLGSFHGRLPGSALDLSASKSLHKKNYPKALDVIHFPYPDCGHCAYEKSYGCNQLCIRIIEKEYLGRLCSPEEINGVIIEPIQGEGGFIVPDALAIRELRKLCSKYDWALVVDEVQSGLGRTGKMFAIEHFGVTPDVICLAKKLGAGIPVGAAVFRADWDYTGPGRHSTTFGGEPAGWAAVKATLEVIEEENLVANAAEVGAYFLEKLTEIKDRFNFDKKRKFVRGGNPLDPIDYIGDVRGLGLMIGVEFVSSISRVPPLRDGNPNPVFRDAVLRGCLAYGILPLSAGHPQRNPIIRFSPPLIATKADIDKISARFEKALNSTLERPK